MSHRIKALLTIAALALALPAAAQNNPPPPTAEQTTKPLPSQTQITAWAAKPAKLLPYTGPNRLVWRLADILAAHKGKPDWAQTVHLDRDFIAQWISLGPGEKTKTMFYADDRVLWEVQSGQIRFTIQGQEPFVASKGFLVQVPKRVPYSMETVGDAPSLRFEVRPSGEAPQYPLTETPTPMPGVQYLKAIYTGHGDYDAINHPYIDFRKQIVEGGQKIGVWVRDDHTYVTILRSEKGVPTPPPTSLGHFHENFPEFWLVVEGTQQFLVEGEKLVTVGDGDLVATPMGRWHRAEPYGPGPSTRLAFIPRPDNLHWYQTDQPPE